MDSRRGSRERKGGNHYDDVEGGREGGREVGAWEAFGGSEDDEEEEEEEDEELGAGEGGTVGATIRNLG